MQHGYVTSPMVSTSSHESHRVDGISQAALEANGEVSKADALALVSSNVEKLLGVKTDGLQADLVATRGGDLLEFSKVVGVISPRRGVVDIL